jgi:hypothetical protein
MATIDDFRSELRAQIRRAEARGAPHVEVNAGELHRQMGGYPGPKHRMPVCCEAMYGEKRDGDEIISAPAKGKGAKLTIRYKLPRRSNP